MIEETLRSTVGWLAGTSTIPSETQSGSREYRTEHDSIGDKEVPADAYYGVQTLRAVENFRITGLSLHPEFIASLAQIKKAAAITNRELDIYSEYRFTEPEVFGTSFYRFRDRYFYMGG